MINEFLKYMTSMACNYLSNKISFDNKAKQLCDLTLKDLQVLNDNQLIIRIENIVKQLEENDYELGDNELSEQIILVLLLNRSSVSNMRHKCICSLLKAIYYCSRKSYDNWLRYCTTCYDTDNGIIIRSNAMLFESSNYRKYLYSTIVDNQISVDVNGVSVSLLDAAISGCQCICGSTGEKMLSFALMTRSDVGLFDLLTFGMNPLSDHSGIENRSLDSCLIKSVDWIWKYSHDFITYWALNKQTYETHMKQTENIFVILLHTIPPQSLCWNHIRHYLKISNNVISNTNSNDFALCNTLRHLCRLRIRSVMAKNWSLPFGIQQLPLPIQIKSYLKLEDINL